MVEDIKMEPGELIWKVLKQQGIILPLSLLQQDFLVKMEEKIKAGYTPTFYFLNELAKNPSSVINKRECNNLFDVIENFHTQISSEGVSLTSDDEKIISFLSSNQKINFRTLLELIGPLQMILEIMNTIKLSEYQKIIEAAIILYIFQNLYELLLQVVDRYLYIYLNENGKYAGGFEDFLSEKKINRREGDHAYASQIDNAFISLKVVGKENNSIFRGFSKILRNKIAHFNMFYDSKRDKIVLLNGKELTLDDLNKCYKNLYLFMYEWLKETMIQKQINKNDLELFLNKALKEAFESLVNEYRRGLRAGVAKRWGDIILYLEREESTNGI